MKNYRRYAFGPIAMALSVILSSAAMADEMANNTADSCRAKLPDSLVTAIAKAYKGYRAPLESDNRPEDVDSNRARGGDGCLGAASGDFQGNNQTDYVLGLTATDGKIGPVVIALAQKGSWKFKSLQGVYETDRRGLYVETVKPGTYRHTPATDLDPGSGESSSMQCTSVGAIFGTIGSTGMLYCYSHGRWQHTLVSD